MDNDTVKKDEKHVCAFARLNVCTFYHPAPELQWNGLQDFNVPTFQRSNEMLTFQRSNVLGMGSCVWLFCICLFFIIGCGSRRDHVTDPAISPVIIPEAITYNNEQGAVVIEWRYLGVEPVNRYRLLRTERGDIPNLYDWVELPPPSRAVSERADIWPMAPILDKFLYSGESYGYTLQTQATLLKPAEEFIGNVQVPGGRLENIGFDLEKGTATVFWHLPLGKPQRYELFRQIDNASPESVFITSNIEDTTFVDPLPGGNQEYKYFLRNYLDQDIVLNSRSFVLRPYMRDPGVNIQGSQDAYMVLTPSNALNSRLLALFTTPTACTIRHLGIDGLSNAVALPVPNRENMNPCSFSIGVMPLGHFLDPYIILAGVETRTPRIQINVFAMRGETAVEIPLTYDTWPANGDDTQTAVAIHEDGHVFVAADQTVKVFEPNGQTLVEVGTISLDLPGDLRNFVVFDSDVWALTKEGRLFRSPINPQRALSPFGWEEIPLPVDVFPVWIDTNQKLLFVLDRNKNRVLVLNAQGQLGFWWAGLDDLNLDTGGLVLSPLIEDVYVWDAHNKIVIFKNTPPAKMVFREEEIN